MTNRSAVTKTLYRWLTLSLLIAFAMGLLGVINAAQAAGVVSISEIRIDQPGTDNDEYFELAGDPGASLDGLTYIVIGDGTGGSGVVEAVVDLTGFTIPAGGYFVAAESTFTLGAADLTASLNFENSDNVTHMLVRDFTGASGDDLDTDDDGVLDVTPWSQIVDSVALLETVGSGDLVYSDTTVGPDGSYVPGHAFRCQTGWEIGEFGTGVDDTPGAENACATGPVPTPTPTVPLVSIYDIQFTSDPSGVSPYAGQTVTTRGVVTAFFYAGGSRYTFIQDGSGPWSGLLLYKPDGYVNVGDLVEVTGDVSEYKGLTEIAFGQVTVLTSGNPLPAPETVASGEVAQEQWESVLVRLEQVTVTDADLGYGEWLVDDGSGGARIDDLGSYSYTPQVGDTLAYVQGPLFYSYGEFKIEPRDDGDILQRATIMQIQGDGQYSPYAGRTVETTGVVTLFTANGSNCWLQDPEGDCDPATSDGIFVSGCAYPKQGSKPQVGDSVRIVAQVQEQQYGNALPLTRLRKVAEIEVLASRQPLPEPVEITDLPDESIPEAIAFWEPLEGMLVSLREARVVGPTSRYGEFAVLTRRDARPGSGYYPQTRQILLRSLGGEEVDYNPERILIDDSTLDEPLLVRPGDRVRSLVGVVDYTYGNYKLQPADIEVKKQRMHGMSGGMRHGPMSGLTITTFNVENLFDLVDNPNKQDERSTPTPEELETKLSKLALAIGVEMRLPAIIVVQEVENTAILRELGDRVNAAAGTDYQAVSFETSDVRGIEVGFLWDANRVTLVEAYQLDDSIVPGVSAAFGPSSPSPGREPLVGVFDVGGAQITIVGNHFKSKGGDDPLFGVNWPPSRVTEVQRKAQARVVRDFVNTILDADPEALVVVAGDLNDFPFSEPGEGPDNPVAILEGGDGEVPLTNLVWQEKDAERFTYIYDGNSQVLDQILVSPALLRFVRGVDILHFNASYPSALGEDATTPLRASDHDPVEMRLRIR